MEGKAHLRYWNNGCFVLNLEYDYAARPWNCISASTIAPAFTRTDIIRIRVLTALFNYRNRPDLSNDADRCYMRFRVGEEERYYLLSCPCAGSRYQPTPNHAGIGVMGLVSLYGHPVSEGGTMQGSGRHTLQMDILHLMSKTSRRERIGLLIRVGELEFLH
jgi:hypothetical protein